MHINQTRLFAITLFDNHNSTRFKIRYAAKKKESIKLLLWGNKKVWLMTGSTLRLRYYKVYKAKAPRSFTCFKPLKCSQYELVSTAHLNSEY